jgi:adenine-specific DNA methylase
MSTTDTHTLAARLARADVGEEFWGRVTEHFRHHATERWKDTLETVRRAGLAIVEAEDGR